MSATFQDFIHDSTPGNKYINKKLGLVKGMVACKVIYAANLKHKVCEMGITRMADELGISKTTVSRALAWLVKENYIVQEKEATNTTTGHYSPTDKLFNIISEGVAERNTTVAQSNTGVAERNQEEETEEEGEEKTTSGSEIDHNYSIVTKAYENEIGLLSSVIKDSIADCVDTYPVDWITEAITISAKQNKRRWSYVEGILKRWKVEGKKSESQNGNGASKKEYVPIPIYNDKGEQVGAM